MRKTKTLTRLSIVNNKLVYFEETHTKKELYELLLQIEAVIDEANEEKDR